MYITKMTRKSITGNLKELLKSFSDITHVGQDETVMMLIKRRLFTC